MGTPPPSAAQTSFTLKTFANLISVKLDEDNFVPWKKQAMACIKANRLKDHLLRSKMPSRFAIAADEQEGNESEEFQNWEQQDQHLVAWLLTFMDLSFTNRLADCEFAHEIWEHLEEYFASRAKSKVKQLKTQLKSVKKLGLSAAEYLGKIKKIADSLSALGAPIAREYYIEAVLERLSEDYGAFITMAMGKSDTMSVTELESLLLSQEDLMEKFRKIELGSIQANVAQSREAYGRGQNGGRRARGRSFRGGRSHWNGGNRPQCQLCGRIGHIVWECYYKFDQSFPNPNNTARNPLSSPSTSFHNPPMATNSNPPQAFLATPSTMMDQAWHPDSGTSHHLTFDPNNLIAGADQVFVGNGSGHKKDTPPRLT